GAGALFSIFFTLRALRPSFHAKTFFAAARYSLPFVPHLIANSLMVGVDRWALEYFGMRDALGLYTLAGQFVVPIQIAANAWNEASSPRFLAAWRDGGDKAARAMLPRIVAGFLGLSGGALLAIVVTMPLLRRFVGPRFQEAFWLVPWLGCVWVV